MKEEISAQAQSVLDKVYILTRAFDNPIKARAVLYQDLAVVPFTNKFFGHGEAAHMIFDLPIEERFEVLRVIDTYTEKFLNDWREVNAMHQGDNARKTARCFKHTIFADKADEIASIISKLPNYEDRENLLKDILSCEKETSTRNQDEYFEWERGF